MCAGKNLGSCCVAIAVAISFAGGSYYQRVDVRSSKPSKTTYCGSGIEFVHNGTSVNDRFKRYITGNIVIEAEQKSTGAVVSTWQGEPVCVSSFGSWMGRAVWVSWWGGDK